MNAKYLAIIFFLSLLSVSFQAATHNAVRIIDTFVTDTNVLIVELEDDAPPAVTVYDSVDLTPEDILGSERDLILVVTEGSAGSVLSCGVSNGTLNLATATGSVGIVTLQYDGQDNSSSINPTGLGGVNLRDNSATSFLISAISDHPTLMTIRIYSGAGFISESVTIIEGDVIQRDYLIPFNSFTGNADFTNVGAIELEIKANIAVDAVIFSFATASSRVYLIAPLDLEHYNFTRLCKVSSSEEEHIISEYNEGYDDSDIYTSSFEPMPSNTSSSSTSTSSPTSSSTTASSTSHLILDSYDLLESSGIWLFIPTTLSSGHGSSNTAVTTIIDQIFSSDGHNSASPVIFSFTLLFTILFIVL